MIILHFSGTDFKTGSWPPQTRPNTFAHAKRVRRHKWPSVTYLASCSWRATTSKEGFAFHSGQNTDGSRSPLTPKESGSAVRTAVRRKERTLRPCTGRRRAQNACPPRRRAPSGRESRDVRSVHPFAGQYWRCSIANAQTDRASHSRRTGTTQCQAEAMCLLPEPLSVES